MCKMRKGRGAEEGTAGMEHPDTYDKLLSRGCNKLNMSNDISGLVLLTLAGAVSSCDGGTHEGSWSLGEYLRKVRKSPAELKQK